MKDEDIIGIYRNGERERAFTEIVKAYSERLFWYVRRYVGCQEDADDLIQEIFVKVWAALPSFRGEARLFTWIYRIATNEALNFLRRQRVRAALNFKSLDAEVERRIDEDTYFNGGEAERRLMKALQKLPQKQGTLKRQLLTQRQTRMLSKPPVKLLKKKLMVLSQL